MFALSGRGQPSPLGNVNFGWIQISKNLFQFFQELIPAFGVWYCKPDFDIDCFAFNKMQLISSLGNKHIRCHTTSTTGLTSSSVFKHELLNNGTGDLRVDASVEWLYLALL